MSANSENLKSGAGWEGAAARLNELTEAAGTAAEAMRLLADNMAALGAAPPPSSGLSGATGEGPATVSSEVLEGVARAQQSGQEAVVGLLERMLAVQEEFTHRLSQLESRQQNLRGY